MNRLHVWRIVLFLATLTAFVLSAGAPRGYGG